MKKLSTLAAVLVLSSLPVVAQVATWDIDSSHSAAHFTVRHMMVSNVRGAFSKVTGSIMLDEKDVTKSSVEASIDATTVDTREPRRDDHLKSAEFFDVAKFPTISFKSTKVGQAAGGKLKVEGELTMHGVTKPVTLDVEPLSAPIKDQRGGFRSGATAMTKISRKDFGLVWNRALEAGGVAVSDEVTVELELELTQKAPPAKAN